ncbi:glycosyltransferase family 4 protein [Neiella sp. HB171785]|uniref:Glycosyltransferase family 4 protein n=1 Tax=Neiella litorisoli TaxID=2771431 RepID=A0A8J6UMC4_9GAMM|nr:glycosyltransferase family 4 protein [Neiella litorisoli]MBD1390510.1 glycosyltransferase family 4 protein [Neiella litorisoli]
MKLAVTCEFRFYRTPDGQVWTDSVFLYEFWLRYLKVFDHVTVVARILDVEQTDPSWRLSSGNKVEFVALPYYVGFVGLLKNMFAIRRVIHHQLRQSDGAIFRVPSQSASIACFLAKPVKPYAVEVVGDPLDVFNSGITGTLFDKVLGVATYLSLQRICKKAAAACYVTQEYLQRRYNTASGNISVGCSDIELPKESIRALPRNYSANASKLVFVGSFEQLYKGPDVLIEAVRLLKQQGVELKVVMLGAGRFLGSMQQLAAQKHCSNNFEFVGAINHADVIRYLDDAEVFVMPSRTEGLPRALIEAMARGLPCVASNVGGIPELLPEQFLVDKDDAKGLADTLASLCLSPQTLTQASANNLAKSREYELDVLVERRTNFYLDYQQRVLSAST